MLIISTNLVALLLTLLIPVAVATLTKLALPSKWKAVLNMLLAGAVVLITSARTENGAAVISTEMAYNWAVTTAVAVASYLGFWKPIASINQTALPQVGVGPNA